MPDDKKYGDLLNPSIKLHRQYFREMVRLLGIRVLYRQCKSDKHYTRYGEIDSNYEPPILVGCIFDSHPTLQTLKKIGWVSELQENASLIHVDYDLPGLQQGCLFIIPSGLDDGLARLFRVTKLQNDIVYPASIVCEIIPEWENTFEPMDAIDYSEKSFNLLHREEDDI